MRTRVMVMALLLLAVPPALNAQVSDAELSRRVAAAAAATSSETLLQGAAAARLLGDMDAAAEILGRAQQSVTGAETTLVNEMLMQAIESGAGANGMMRAFREARSRLVIPPQQIAAWVQNYPTLLTGGEFDEMILQMSPDHPDPEYRCACLFAKAWVHRVAGRMDESQKFWAELAVARESEPVPADDPQLQGQYARDLARAGRTGEARQVLRAAMAMAVTDEERPAAQRRWAQALAELGDVEGAVALLEPLLESSTLVTVNSLSTRYTWAPIRDDPAFQEMLARHR